MDPRTGARSLVAALAVAWICAGIAGPAEAGPTARFVATKLQGDVCVAPCAVHFDAIGDGASQTTDSAFPRAFHSLVFHWNFGDPGSGHWSTDGSSRDSAVGAIAGHLYETPGTYTVRLTATNPHGEHDAVEAQVVVTDPNQHFGDANTWCFANAGTPGGAGFEACPSRRSDRHVVIPASLDDGFGLALSSSYCRAVSTKARCLFRAGDRFDQNVVASVSGTAGPGLISRFGGGADPQVIGGGGFVFVRSGWTIAGFDVTLSTSGSGYSFFRVIQQEGRITLANVRGRNLRAACVEIETGFAPRHSERIGIIGLDCLNVAGTGSQAGLYLRGERVLVMGNVIDDAYEGQFVLRTVHFPWSVVQHNRLLRPGNDPGDQRNAIQIRAWAGNGGGGGAIQPTPTATRFVVVSDNVIGQDNASVFLRTCQTNDCTDSALAQDVRDMVIERNFLFFTSTPGGAKSRMARAFWLQGGDITVRDNILDLQGIESGNAPEQDRLVDQQGNMASAPSRVDDRIHVFNNAVYFDESVQRTYRFCASLAAGTGHRCQNNLAWLPNHSGPKYSDDGPDWSSSNNVFASSSPFAAPIPNQGASNGLSFQLSANASIAVDAGYDFGVEDAGTHLDFGARCRPVDGPDGNDAPDWDVGPWEQAANLDCLPAPEPDASLAGVVALLSLALRLCQSPRRAERR